MAIDDQRTMETLAATNVNWHDKQRPHHITMLTNIRMYVRLYVWLQHAWTIISEHIFFNVYPLVNKTFFTCNWNCLNNQSNNVVDMGESFQESEGVGERGWGGSIYAKREMDL